MFLEIHTFLKKQPSLLTITMIAALDELALGILVTIPERILFSSQMTKKIERLLWRKISQLFQVI